MTYPGCLRAKDLELTVLCFYFFFVSTKRPTKNHSRYINIFQSHHESFYLGLVTKSVISIVLRSRGQCYDSLPVAATIHHSLHWVARLSIFHPTKAEIHQISTKAGNQNDVNQETYSVFLIIF